MPSRKTRTINRKIRIVIKKKKIKAPKTFPQNCSKDVNSKVIGSIAGKQLGNKKRSFKKEGVKQIVSEFNKISNNISLPSNNEKSNIARGSKIIQIGLSKEEKSYSLCSFGNKSDRYLKLKKLATIAKKENKVFSVYGGCNDVRKALVERGWVEKMPSNSMSLSKIQNGKCSNSEKQRELDRLLLSDLVENCTPNFIWCTRENRLGITIDMTKDHTIINKLAIHAEWTSKRGLCSSLKRNYWFYIEDIAEVKAPRTYNISDLGELESFKKDFKMTACTSLLKWILYMVAKDKPIFMTTGKISFKVIMFALNRCKEYLFQKQNKDIDRNIKKIRENQWRSFLKKYYSLIKKKEVFEASKVNQLPLYLSCAKFLLRKIHRYRPQLSCEGCHNIWIIKPAYCSRGKGIRMASKLEVIINILNKANCKYVIQKYIEEPLLIYETKFDIRQYYLITSTYPLIIWMYTDCYLKFSSQKYSLKDYHESIHLTNNAVQKKYCNCTGRNTELPNYNMWDSEKYKHYLNINGKKKVWDNIIYPGMKRSIIGIVLGCQDTLSINKNRFELYGCDFLLDKEYRPWLIEINSGPDLKHTTQVTAKICPAVISDILKVVIDFANDPKAGTGKFECIYRQPMTLPRYRSPKKMLVRGYSLPSEYFFKGNVQIKELYDDTIIGEENDINSVLHTIKKIYTTYNFVTQLQDHSASIDACTDMILSDCELNMTADVINEQIDETKSITVAKSESSFNNNTMHKVCFLKQQPLHDDQNTCNVTDNTTLLRKSNSRFLSQGVEKVHSFSKLDDELKEKVCVAKSNVIKEIFNSLTLNNNVGHSSKSHKLELFSNSYSQEVLQATTKILSFIKRKEKEYHKHK